jgi:hypothetical protein
VGFDGQVRWSRTVAVDRIRFGEGPQATAASSWNRLPVKPACGADAIVSRILPEPTESSAEPSIGRLVAFDWEGGVLMNAEIPRADTLLIYAGWYARDSLFYATTSSAAWPRTLVFRLRPRKVGDGAVFAIPQEVRDSLSAEPSLVTP